MTTAILRVFSRALILALLFAVVLPFGAFADEGTPPPPTEEPAPPPEEGGEVAEEPAVEKPVGEEPMIEEPIVEELVIEEPVIEEPVVEDFAALLAELPEETEIVIMSEEGEPLPMVSTEAAEVIASGDPMWCPVGVTPGGIGCTGSYGSLLELVSAIDSGAIAQPNANGVIWIEGGTDTSVAPIIIDGTDPQFSTWANFSLTLKGGWSGDPNTITNPATPSIFNQALGVVYWKNDVTLSDIVVTEVIADPLPALQVITNGKISLTRVESSGNDGLGTYLDNDGVEGKDVTISFGTFEDNGDGDGDENGLQVMSKGVITLSSIKANWNGAYGAYLGNSGAGTPKNVFLTSGYFEFNNNGGNGLSVDSKGLISLKDIDAIHNGITGVVLSNLASGVTFSGTNVFGENGLDGLAVNSNGAITISNLIANENNRYGASLVNNGGTAPITLTGTSEVKFNDSTGLQVLSSGAISISNLTATNNFYSGAVLDNQFSSAGQSVTLSGTNIFDYNGDYGLEVNSKGAISLNNVQARNNGFRSIPMGGVDLDNHLSTLPKTVILNGINAFSDNAGDGLRVLSKGAITINNICSAENGGWGAFLYNDYDGSVGGVTVTGTAGFTTTGGGFFDNSNTGLEIWSRGTVTLKDMDAISNGFHGIYIVNASGTGNVTVGTSILPWRFGLLENEQSGIEIYSRGSITLNRVAASGNGGDGAILYNAYDGIAKPISITTSGSDALSRADFNLNGGNGLTIQSHGAITAAHLNASENGWGFSGGYGANLDNCILEGGVVCTTSVPASVTLTGDNTFSWNSIGAINGGFGLKILSKGAITGNNLITDNNEGVGASLRNSYAGATGGVTVSNSSSYWPHFNSNWLSGLSIYSNGSIVVKDFDASENGNDGVELYNTNGTGNITVGTSRPKWSNGVWNNGYSGIWIETNGTVTTWNLWGDANGEYGIYVDNSLAGSPKSVTFNATMTSTGPNWNLMDGNGETGYYIISKGPITLNYCSAWGNGTVAPSLVESRLGAGIYIDNMSYGSPLSPQNVTLNGINVEENYYSGIEVWTYGSIVGKNFNAEDNGWGQPLEIDRYGYGAYLDNSGGSISKPVTLTGTNIFEENWTTGLEINSYDAITVSNLEAWNNQGKGAELNNVAGLFKPVNITGYADVGENGSTGLHVQSRGLIMTAALYADGNGWDGGADGVQLYNNYSGAIAGVTLNGNNGFYANWGNGLYIGTFGPIKANNLRGEFNNNIAVYLHNDWAGSTTAATVTITGTQHLDFNGDNGLLVYSRKAITISNLNAEGNYSGAGIYNVDSGAASPQNVTITGSSWIEGNAVTGLIVRSYGSITISNLQAHGNGGTFGGSGASLDNCNYDGLGCQTLTPKPITLTGSNSFTYNDIDGLVAQSMGAIKVNNLTAYWNGFDGALLNNQWGQGTLGGFVTLTGTNELSHNGNDGLNIFTHGNITVNNLSASWNGEDGVILDNYGVSGPPVTVSMTGTNTFNGNGDWLVWAGVGLSVHSEGNIAINNLTANWNAEHGAVLNTIDYHYGFGNVTLSGVNTFLGNQEDGLQIEAWGAATLNKVRADDNGGSGVYVYTEVGNITIACGSMTHNGNYGWYLDAGTSITLKAVVALGNAINTWSNVPPIAFRSC